ncbi:dienelactone hydrolase endo-1,3,1,4-beta-D-glucanase [Lactarius quietus]|nr:dienelactone hydrolase endo-1,3,1,4-beta-D-glucanase [Lactarius quietus]
MTSPSLGVRHEGTPEGTYEEIKGIKTYVATPKTDYPKDKAILYLTDAFVASSSSLPILLSDPYQLLADDFARNGFKVYVPDLFEGDPVEEDAFKPGGNFDIATWFAKHASDHTGKRVRTVIEELKSKGVTVFGATGYCYGGRLVFDLAFDNIISVSVIYLAKSKAPLLVNSCETDSQFPKEFAETTDEKFAKYEHGYKRTYWEGCNHGFAVRGDPKIPAVAAGKKAHSRLLLNGLSII